MGLLDGDWIASRERLFETVRGQMQLAEVTGARAIAFSLDDLAHLLSLAELGAGRQPARDESMVRKPSDPSVSLPCDHDDCPRTACTRTNPKPRLTDAILPARESAKRAHHLTWNGTEWVDDRCGCRYHPDDDNGSHGGAPHVHRCEAHREPAHPAAPVPAREQVPPCGLQWHREDEAGGWELVFSDDTNTDPYYFARGDTQEEALAEARTRLARTPAPPVSEPPACEHLRIRNFGMGAAIRSECLDCGSTTPYGDAAPTETREQEPDIDALVEQCRSWGLVRILQKTPLVVSKGKRDSLVHLGLHDGDENLTELGLLVRARLNRMPAPSVVSPPVPEREQDHHEPAGDGDCTSACTGPHRHRTLAHRLATNPTSDLANHCDAIDPPPDYSIGPNGEWGHKGFPLGDVNPDGDLSPEVARVYAIAACWAHAAELIGADTSAPSDEFYLLDTRSVVGNCALWWCPDGHGYTTQLSEAGLYSREDAVSHRETDVPVPRALAERLSVTHVRMEALRSALDVRGYNKTTNREERDAWLTKACARLGKGVTATEESR